MKPRPILRRFGLAVLATFAVSSVTPAQSLDRSAPPEIGPAPAFAPPPVQRFELSNGLEVLLVEKHEVPLVQVNLMVRAGSADDPDGKSGLASMTAAMLDEGAGERDALELADAIDFLGADLGVSAGEHATTLRLHTPLSKLGEALPILADVALRPTFPVEELERLRAERLTTLLQWHDEPRAIAAVAFDRTLFGDGHPYGAPSLGTEASLRAFTVEDLEASHARSFTPDRATLVVTGDVTAETIRPRLEEAFGAWRGEAAGSAGVPAVPQPSGVSVYLVDKPGAAQSEIRIGRLGPPRTTQDYYALTVMNTILGGSFTSRLNQNLREDKGWSYGAFSFFDFRPHPGPWTALAAVQTAVTDSALVEFTKELRGILEEVSTEELERARNYVSLGFPERFQTVARTARMVEEIAEFDLPVDYWEGYVGKIRSVTVEDVRRVAEEHIDPASLAIVVVGDLEQIEAGVRALELGPVTTMEIEQVLGPPPVLTDAGEQGH